ncbi:MAG: YidC/Oxa1 family insertase periplasmic-domain containing protein [Planctomycetales bacterium]|nr:YidC/Oxa1 family insertase periplasmic-domain containing protein [Planctomycetales bacterium]
MDKRFASFLALTCLILLVNAFITGMLREPEPLPGDAPADNQVAKQPGDHQDKPAASSTAATEPNTFAGQPPEPAADEPAVTVAGTQSAPERMVTLGSVDPDLAKNPYRLLATFTTRGAAIERLELASPRYRDIQDRGGYLGHLGLVADTKAKGCRVRVVGPGTPAAAAGIQVDDVIQGVGPAVVPTRTPDEMAVFTTSAKPGQTIQLSVLRNGKTLKLPVTLIRRPLEVMRPEIENLQARDEEPPEDFTDPPSLLLTLGQLGDRTIDKDAVELAGLKLHSDNWELFEQNGDSVAFRYVIADPGIEVIKRYTIATVPAENRDDANFAAYHLEVAIAIRNLGSDDQEIAYRLQGPTGLPTEGWWYGHKISRTWSGVGLRDWVLQANGAKPQMWGPSKITEGEVDPYGQSDSFVYTGIDGQYFSAVLIPQKKDVADVWYAKKQAIRLTPVAEKEDNPTVANITCQLDSQPVSLAAGGPALEHKFVFFTGPKVPDLLANYQQPAAENYSLTELVYYGTFGPIARAMVGILHLFYSIIGNYGLAIICLTVLVRGCMFPLSRKQALNMAKMQELQPEMKRLQEKYKKDLQKRSQAQQELFRKHNYNPMGGCLLMFLQFPIFIGLYRGLMIDIELRDASVFGHAIRWCSNLAAPDMLYDWSGFMPDFINSAIGIFGLGPYLNVLPLVTVGLFIVQQKMFMPPAVDEQAAMQQKIMKYMMVFMGLLFYKVASGLCIYFIASSLWGIAERKMLPKTMKKANGDAAAAGDKPAAADKPKLPLPGSNGNSSTSSRKKKKRSR